MYRIENAIFHGPVTVVLSGNENVNASATQKPVEIGDCIRFEIENLGEVTAIVQQVTDADILYMTDDCVMRAPMNNTNTNEGGYEASELKKNIENLLTRFPDDLRRKITYIAPPTYGQMFGHDEWYKEAIEPDDDEQLPLMKKRKNRIADFENDYSWYWLKNATKKEYSASNFALVYYDGNANCGTASNSRGVRVVFRVKK